MAELKISFTAAENEILALGKMITIFLCLDKAAQGRVVTYLEAMFRDPKVGLKPGMEMDIRAAMEVLGIGNPKHNDEIERSK